MTITFLEPEKAGGKALGLARLQACGLRVPPFRCLTAHQLQASPQDLKALYQEISQHLHGELILRSSAEGEDGDTHSWAGRFDSIPDIESGEDFITAAALALRKVHQEEQSLDEMFFIIQENRMPSHAGALFSLDPITGAHEVAVLEWVQGHAAALMEGRDQPERLRVIKSDLPERPEFPNTSLLAAMMMAIDLLEKSLGCPVDVEWVVTTHGGLEFVQVRPITGVDVLPGHAGSVFSNANFVETMPEPVSQMGFDILRRLMKETQRSHFGSWSLLRTKWDLLVRIHGRVHWNLTPLFSWPRFMAIPMVDFLLGTIDTELAGKIDKAFSYPLKRKRTFPFADHFRIIGMIVWGGPKLLWQWGQLFFGSQKTNRARYRLEQSRIADLEKRLHEARTIPALQRELLQAPTQFCQSFLVRAVPALMACFALSFLLCRWGARLFRTSPSHIMTMITRWSPETMTMRMHRHLANLAMAPDKSKVSVDGFVRLFGHRGPREQDIATPRFGDQPELVKELLNNMEGSSLARRLPRKLGQDINRLRRDRPGFVVALEIRVFAVVCLKVLSLMPMRENLKHHVMKFLAAQRQALLRLEDLLIKAGRPMESNDIFHLDLNELAALCDGRLDDQALSALLTERKLRLHANQARRSYGILIGDGTVIGTLHDRLKRRLNGTGVSPGQAQGPVFTARNFEEAVQVPPGSVLVARALDPAWGALMSRVAGIVVEIGGTLSHGSVLAREQGCPMVVGVRGMMAKVSTGQVIALDGDSGWVALDAGEKASES